MLNVIHSFDFLFFLFRFNLVKLVILLLDNGASVTVRNHRELTPLQYAHVRKLNLQKQKKKKIEKICLAIKFLRRYNLSITLTEKEIRVIGK